MMDDGDDHQNHRGFTKVVQNIHDADPFCFPVCPDGAYDGRGYAVAQINADNHGIDRLERQQAAGGKRLQDTNRRGGTLQRESHARAGQIAQEGVVAKARKQVIHGAGFLQHTDSAGHIQQAGKKNSESDGDIADGFGIPEDPGHDQNNSDDQGNRSKGGRLKQTKE